jgi:hypothetical protein
MFTLNVQSNIVQSGHAGKASDLERMSSLMEHVNDSATIALIDPRNNVFWRRNKFYPSVGPDGFSPWYCSD